MKKSQILAALALAFALGVVAPVASASAYVMSGEGKADVEKAISDAMTAANKLGNCTEGSSNMLSAYNDLIYAVNNGEKSIATAKESAYTTLKNNLKSSAFVQAMVAAGEEVENAAWKSYSAFTVDTYTNYDSLLAFAEGLLDGLQAEYEADPTLTAVISASGQLWAGTSGYVYTAKSAVQTADNNARTAINNVLSAAPFTQGVTDNTSYAKAADAAKLVPKYNNFEVLLKQYFTVANIKDSTTEGFRVSTAQAQVDILNEQIENFCSTNLTGTETPKPDTTEPETPSTDEDGKGGANAPAAGALAKADATAKATVSIMAAIASVATAAFVAIRKIAASKKA